LNINLCCLKVLKLSDCNLPTLHNVSHLKLSINKHSGWQFLPDLLKSLPNLLALYFPMVSLYLISSIWLISSNSETWFFYFA